VAVNKGETVLDLARREGVYIPTLCYHPAVEPYSVCRLCIVEVREGRRVRVVTACSYPITRDGLEIQTDTERVRRNRRIILELLLARCPGSRKLREMAAEMGVSETRFSTGDAEELCILCGLCERVCEHLVRVGAISRAHRGVHRRVTTPFGEPPSECIGCGACAFVCPTGAVEATSVGRYISIAPWGAEVEMACCSVCGRPFAPRALIERAAQTLGVEFACLSVCFSCRRSGHGHDLAKALSAVGTGRASSKT
jgi:bidirectional [NiFe] hydrogenase diaphorase subunit